MYDDLQPGANGLVQRRQPVSMPAGPPTVARILDGRTGSQAVALIDRDGTLSYSALDAAVAAGAAALEKLGLQPGDRLAASATSHNALVIAFLAAQRLGLVWVGINRALATPEKCGQLADCGARALIGDPETIGQIRAVAAEVPGLEIWLTTGSNGNAEWPGLIAAHAGGQPSTRSIDPQAPAAISYTSGTTGLPKGVVHSQHGIMTFVNGGFAAGRGGTWQPGLRRSVTIPLTILNGMNFGPLVALAGGGSFVAMDRIDSAGVAEWVERTGIEALGCAVATVRDLLLKPELQSCNLSSLRYAFAGGSGGAEELRDLFRARFGSELVEEYGMTEAPSGVASGFPDMRPLPGTLGRAYDHLEIAALNGDGQRQPPGEAGEIAIRATHTGPWAGVFTGMLGYWNQPEQTMQTLRDGWLRTGDIGTLDAEGNIAIVGRQKEVIIRGGGNIYPAEVERVLRGLPEIADAVVLGLPDPRLGEIVGAFVELKADGLQGEAAIEALRGACLARIARYKVPERWIFVDAIPRNAVNKVDRAKLIAIARGLA